MSRAQVQPVFVDQPKQKLPQWVFRVRSRGNAYYYYQANRSGPKDARGPVIRLPDDPASQAFEEAVLAASRASGPVKPRVFEKGAGYVYFLVSGAYVKIGFTTKPAGRLSTLSTGLGTGVQAFVLVPGSRAMEARLHREFADDRVRAEWFKVTTKLMQRIGEAAVGKLKAEAA